MLKQSSLFSLRIKHLKYLLTLTNFDLDSTIIKVIYSKYSNYQFKYNQTTDAIDKQNIEKYFCKDILLLLIHLEILFLPS